MLEEFLRQLVTEMIRTSAVEAVLFRFDRARNQMLEKVAQKRREHLRRLIHGRNRARLIHKYTVER